MAEVPRLGERGGGWVALQFLVMALAVAAMIFGPRWPDGAARPVGVVIGVVLVLAGALLAFASSRALGKSLTPYPRPAEPGVFVERGPYRWVRHPIYLGGTLVFAGLSLVFSPWALAVTGVLTLLWALKLRVEERMLEERYPQYAVYRRHTRSRLVPYVY